MVLQGACSPVDKVPRRADSDACDQVCWQRAQPQGDAAAAWPGQFGREEGVQPEEQSHNHWKWDSRGLTHFSGKSCWSPLPLLGYHCLFVDRICACTLED